MEDAGHGYRLIKDLESAVLVRQAQSCLDLDELPEGDEKKKSSFNSL